MWLFCISVAMASVATQNLSLEKACRVNLAYDAAVCDALSARNTAPYGTEEAQVQQLTVRMFGWRAFFQAAIPTALIPFVGSWSDRHGRRRPFMLLPIAGEIVNAAAHLVCTYFYLQLPIEADLFCEALFPSVTGGKHFLYMAAYTYIADVTTQEQRTYRMGLVNLFSFSGVPIGTALSGILYDRVGFYGVFSLSLFMHVCSFALCIALVKETPKEEGEEPSGLVAIAKDFFDIHHLKDTVNMAFRGSAAQRLQLNLLMLLVVVHLGSLGGEGTIQYLYLRRKFNWDGLMYSYFSTFGIGVNVVGMAISTGVLTSWLRLRDSVVGMIASVSRFLGSIAYCFAPTTTLLMLALTFDLFTDTVYIAMRAITSKVVPVENLGKANSLIGLSESLSPILFGPVYSATYYATIDDLPGAYYLISCVMAACTFTIFGWFFVTSQQAKKTHSSGANQTPLVAVPSDLG